MCAGHAERPEQLLPHRFLIGGAGRPRDDVAGASNAMFW
jgi:hypothetical protein